MKYALAVHGGAWNIPDDLWQPHYNGCSQAYEAGMAILSSGGSAVEAVTAAIRIMEDDATFDAGYGSFLNEDGQVELDAGLMEGAQLRSGAVLGVSRIKNPIDLAAYVLTNSDHCLFTGEGAHRLADRAGFVAVSPEIHVHPRERDLIDRIRAGEKRILSEAWVDRGHDTVGAIALDGQGNLAAGNSTGGIIHKAVGRVGDAPLIGSGFYADNQRGAFVCTGWGEPIMRSAMGMFALDELGRQMPQEAAERALAHMHGRTGGFAGILLMTPDGRCAVAHNTERMAFMTADRHPWH